MANNFPFDNRWNGMIRLEIIDHSSQRYDTCGDWTLDPWADQGIGLNIKVSETGSSDMNFALFMHELNESLLYLYKNGFSKAAVDAVDKFDMNFEENREDDTSEPGGDQDCPVYTEHMLAMAIEHMIAEQLNLDWNKYSQTITGLEWAQVKCGNCDQVFPSSNDKCPQCGQDND